MTEPTTQPPLEPPAGPRRDRRFALLALAVILVLAAVVSFYASSAPDGLEKVAADKGINAEEKDHPLGDSPLADYGTKGVDDARLSGGLAGVAGVALTLAAGGALFLLVRRRGGPDTGGEDGGDRAAGRGGSGGAPAGPVS